MKIKYSITASFLGPVLQLAPPIGLSLADERWYEDTYSADIHRTQYSQ